MQGPEYLCLAPPTLEMFFPHNFYFPMFQKVESSRHYRNAFVLIHWQGIVLKRNVTELFLGSEPGKKWASEPSPSGGLELCGIRLSCSLSRAE